MAVGEQNLMAERVDDEEVGVHVIHDGLEGFAHLLFFAAPFLFEELRVKPETIGGLFVVEVDARTLAARLSGAVYEAGKSEGIIGCDGDADGKFHGIGFAVERADGSERPLEVAGEVGHLTEGLVLIRKQDERTGAAVDGHIVLAGEVAEDGRRVLEKKVLPAIAVTLLDLVEVAEIHEDESLQVEACEKVFFNNGLPGFERVQPRQG